MAWLKFLSFLLLLQQATLSSARTTVPRTGEDVNANCAAADDPTEIGTGSNKKDFLAPTPGPRGWEKPTVATYKSASSETTASTTNKKKHTQQTNHHQDFSRSSNTKHHNQHQQHHGASGQKYVTAAVLQARELARECAKKRSALLDQSQVAWFEGDKHEAKSLSNEGKEWGHKMDEANAKAAKLILEPQKSVLTGELDLHGLYLKEALAATEVFLTFWLTQNRRDKRTTVLIITGAGHHSKHKDQPVIRPKVVSMLREKKLKYARVNKNGALRVSLPRRQ